MGSAQAQGSLQPAAQASTPSASTQSQPASLSSLPSTSTGVGVNQQTISPGQVESNNAAGASSILAPQANPTAQVSQSFLPASLTAPFYNNAATAGNLGTQTGSLTNGATNVLNTLFNNSSGSANNYLSNMESGSGVNYLNDQLNQTASGNSGSYLNSLESNTLSPAAQASLGAGTQAATVALDQGLAQQNAQFMGTPFSSALPVAQGNIIGQYANNLTQQAANLGLQQMQLGSQAAQSQQQLASSNAQTQAQLGNQAALQQQSLAAQQSEFPFNYTLSASQVPVNDAQGLYNMASQNYSQPYTIPSSIYSQIPYLSPTTVTQTSGANKSLI